MNVEHQIGETTKKQSWEQCQLLANSEPTTAIENSILKKYFKKNVFSHGANKPKVTLLEDYFTDGSHCV